MPKVTFSNAKGILQEAGTGFQVNDAPILMESESVAGNVVITVTPDVLDSGDGDSLMAIEGKYFLIATPDEEWYVWFDSGDADATDPAPLGLTAANSIRISDDTTAIANEADACNAILHRINASNGGADGMINYSDTALDGSTTVLTGVLGPADDNGDDAADTASLGADDVSGKFVAATDGTDVTITVLPVGSVADSLLKDAVNAGDLVDMGTGVAGADDWAVTLADGTGANGSALQSFGTSVISNAGSETATATLATAAVGTKKLVIQSGAGAIDMSYDDHAGTAKTASFDADAEALYLLSTGLGWGVITNVGSVGIA